jgi:hypothetical protein
LGSTPLNLEIIEMPVSLPEPGWRFGPPRDDGTVIEIERVEP